MGPRLLVVEDDRDSREMLEHVCRDDGHTVRAVSSIDAAVSALGSEPFDVILTDCFTGIHGDLDDADRLLRAAGDTPVIAHTAWPIDVGAALRRGFVQVLRKPADLETLLSAVRTAAERKKR